MFRHDFSYTYFCYFALKVCTIVNNLFKLLIRFDFWVRPHFTQQLEYSKADRLLELAPLAKSMNCNIV